MKLVRLCLTLLLVLAGARTASARDGVLDSSFGNAGRRILTSSIGRYEDCYMVVLPSGKILLLTYQDGTETDASTWGYVLIRLNPDGKLDTTFGQNGKLMLQGPIRYVRDMVLGPDGKIYLVGNWEETSWGPGNGFLGRLNQNGSWDATFGDQGLVKSDLLAGYSEIFGSIMFDGDGLLAAGAVGSTWNEAGAGLIARFDLSGKLDTRFNGHGFLRLKNLKAADTYHGVSFSQLTPGANNTLLLCGSYNDKYAVFRYTRTGTSGAALDPTFSGDGIAFSDGYWGESYHVFQVGERILTSGISDDYAIIAFTNSGTIDKTFGTNGSVAMLPSTQFTPLGFQLIYDLSLDAAGRILVSGYSVNRIPAAKSNWVVARFLPDGQPDLDFGTNGAVLTSFPGYETCQAEARVVRAVGNKVIAAGIVARQHSGWDYVAVARYASGSTLPAISGRLQQVLPSAQNSTQITPLSGRTVTLAPSGQTTVSDSDGRFRFTSLAPGTYFVQPESAGTGSAKYAEVQIASGNTPLTFQWNAIFGRVTDSNGLPLAKTSVRIDWGITTAGKTAFYFRTTATDADGNYVFPELVKATYAISAGKKGYTFSPAKFTRALPSSGQTWSPMSRVNFTAVTPQSAFVAGSGGGS